MQGCALAEPGGPWRLTFALGRLENLRFFIQIICWEPLILQFQSTGLPSIFLYRLAMCMFKINFAKIIILFILNSHGQQLHSQISLSPSL